MSDRYTNIYRYYGHHVSHASTKLISLRTHTQIQIQTNTYNYIYNILYTFQIPHTSGIKNNILIQKKDDMLS